jgi:hypothetical protein
MSIERLRLETDFGDELALQKTLEVLGIGGLGFGKHALVHNLVDWSSLHLDGWAGCEERKIVILASEDMFRGSADVIQYE